MRVEVETLLKKVLERARELGADYAAKQLNPESIYCRNPPHSYRYWQMEWEVIYCITENLAYYVRYSDLENMKAEFGKTFLLAYKQALIPPTEEGLNQ